MVIVNRVVVVVLLFTVNTEQNLRRLRIKEEESEGLYFHGSSNRNMEAQATYSITHQT